MTGSHLGRRHTQLLRNATAPVVRLYVHPRVTTVVQPIRRLAGFERIELEAGESREIMFPVGPAQLAILNNRVQRTIETGLVDTLVDTNAAYTASAQFEVRTRRRTRLDRSQSVWKETIECLSGWKAKWPLSREVATVSVRRSRFCWRPRGRRSS
ncbi:fibronectin type III-like domain-contianing protein [Frankia sp. R82]|uniref:fibronectin type III-like domain-contianing protein n=1 Tax=Frankia sp. R82 TaxID=2950553 RepID=UPI0035AB9388